MEKNGTFYFDPEDKIFKDHFPGSPVVPGSLIVYAFTQAVEKQLDIFGKGAFSPNKNYEKKQMGPGNGQFLAAKTIYPVQQFRFKKFVTPGEYAYSLVFESGRVKCQLCDDNIPVATGTLLVQD